MTISHYSNAIVDLMLGWLRGFANWVLRRFNLAGSAGGWPLLWLSQNWLKLLIFFLGGGVSYNAYTAARPVSVYSKNINEGFYMIRVDLFTDLSEFIRLSTERLVVFIG